MGLLDELKKEAEIRKSQEEEAAKKQQAREEIYRTKIQPAMQRIYQYFVELTEHLNLVKPQVLRSYALASAVTLDQLLQQDYAISTDTEMQKVAFSLLAIGREKPLEFERSGAKDVQQLKDYLWRYNLRFQVKESRDERGDLRVAKFYLQEIVTLNIDFIVNRELSVIEISVRNFDSLGERKSRTDATKVDDAFLDGLGRYVLGQPGTFADLIKQEIPVEVREKLRAQVEKEQRLRTRELESVLSEEDGATSSEKRESRLMKILRTPLFKSGSDRAD